MFHLIPYSILFKVCLFKLPPQYLPIQIGFFQQLLLFSHIINQLQFYLNPFILMDYQKIIGPYCYHINCQYGKGSSSTVFKGFKIQSGQQVAIKVIDHQFINNQVTRYLYEGQLEAHHKLKSPFIITTLDVLTTEHFTYIILESCPKGTLKNLIESMPGKCLPENKAISILYSLILGEIAILDSLLVHRDLKSTNILIKQNNEPVIIDFGYCERMMEKRPLIQYKVGSPSYMSPQVYFKNRYSEKSDVWALGIIYYEMITGVTLDYGINIQSYFKGLLSGLVTVNFHNKSQISIELLQAALSIDPENRATCYKLKYIIDKWKISLQKPQLARYPPLKPSTNRSGYINPQFGQKAKSPSPIHKQINKEILNEKNKLRKLYDIGAQKPSIKPLKKYRSFQVIRVHSPTTWKR